MNRKLVVTLLAGAMLLPVGPANALPDSASHIQDAKKERVKRAPARLRVKDRAVTVIPAAQVSERPVLDISVKPAPAGMKVKANVKTRPDPKQGAAGSFKGPGDIKIKFKLTPREPAISGRGRLDYNYPNNVRTSKDQNYAEYSKGNIPGSLYYHVRLVEDRKYLIEIEVGPAGSAGGNITHTVGDNESTHTFSNLDKFIVSRVVQPEATGWIYGRMAQANTNPPSFWHIYSVSVTQLD